ncbi:MAG TPA: hypothetical protein VLT82_19050 [Myxococcaceae bacterium]|nr:hypothetical protein [Myxococcaceae bacterium]
MAVAVSDFCRRAGAPASPRAVREALSALAESDDFRVRAVTDAEPPVHPLGPFAVVDLARGTAADVAGLRQRSGYYALVAEMLALHDAPRADPSGSAPPVAAPQDPVEGPVAQAAVTSGASPVRAETRAPTVAERIAPRRRAMQPPAAPRGRFTQVEAQRAPLESLEADEGRSTLTTLLRQHGHRPALLRALAQGYTGRRGEPSASELDALLTAHGLLGAVEASERELILEAVSEHRGALGRVAWTLGLRGPELSALISRLGLDPEVDRLRERFRREALTPASWTARLDLFGRRKYLEDLGVERDFEERLRGDLMAELHAAGANGDDAASALAQRLAVPEALVARALDRLGLQE